jgi:hypothetical protein
MPRELVLRPSRRLLRQALHSEVDRVFDHDETACFEVVKANEHVEFFEYPRRRTPMRQRMKTTIFAFETAPERRKAAR